MLEDFGTNPTLSGIAIVSAIVSLIYVAIQFSLFLWSKRGFVTRGYKAQRYQAAKRRLAEFTEALGRKEAGKSDFVIAIPNLQKALKSFAGLMVGALFLMVSAAMAGVIKDKSLIVSAVIATGLNFMFDAIRFGGHLNRILWIVAAVNYPEYYKAKLEGEMARFEPVE